MWSFSRSFFIADVLQKLQQESCCIHPIESANDIHHSTLISSRDLTDDVADEDQTDRIDLNHGPVIRESLTHFARGGYGVFVVDVVSSTCRRQANGDVDHGGISLRREFDRTRDHAGECRPRESSSSAWCTAR